MLLKHSTHIPMLVLQWGVVTYPAQSDSVAHFGWHFC